MRLSIRALIFTACFSASAAVAEAEGSLDHRSLCSSFSENIQWRPADRELAVYVRDETGRYLSLAGVDVDEIIVCAAEVLTIQNDTVIVGDDKKVFRVGVGMRFVREMGEHLSAVLAHEVAHKVIHDGGACGRFFNSGNAVREAECEHDVDRVAAGWVGTGAVLAALEASRETCARSDTPRARHCVELMEKRIMLIGGGRLVAP